MAPGGTHDDERDLGRILRAAGPRVTPPEDVERAARAAVRAEWLQMVAARQAERRRQRHVTALAASLVVAVGAAWVGVGMSGWPGATVASVERAVGEPSYAYAFRTFPRAVAPGQTLRAGAEIHSDDLGGVALRLASGIEIRLDRDSRVELGSDDRLVLLAGAVYVDSDGPAGSERLVVETPVGTLEHLGTQYEARLLEQGVRVRVRDGAVLLQRAGGEVLRTAAGEQLIVPVEGTVSRSAIPWHADTWQWVGDLAPTFDIDGRTLDEFLVWASRELGRELHYADERSRGVARRTTLSGSVDGLEPREALEAVLLTTPLRGGVEADGRLIVTRIE